MPSEQSDTKDSADSVKEELDRLTNKQDDILRRAIYVGMTLDVAKEYDERRQQITNLIRELALLKKAK